MKLAPALAALAAVALPSSAIAQEQRCIPREDSQAVVANLLPALLESAARTCGPQIGQGYLAANSAALAQRLAPQAQRNWPQAKDTLEYVMKTELPDNEAVLQFGRQALAEGITSKLDRDACLAVDRLTEQLAPLPPQNFANVFALFLELGMSRNEDTELKICPANEY